MDRRQYIKAVATGLTVGTAGLAGCASPGDENGTDGVGTLEDGTDDELIGTDTETSDGTQTTAGTDQAGGTTDGGAGATTEVSMLTDGSDYLFDPVGLYVEPGTTITWVNDSGGHSTTAYTEDNPLSDVNRIPDGAEGWNSETLTEEGAEFTYTFDVEGTYDYYCVPHKTQGMIARIVVGEPSGFDDNPPNGPVPAENRIVQERVVTQEEFNP